MEIGIDIVEVSRFSGEHSQRNLFDKDELGYCYGYAYPAEHLAGKFAAKEAVRKALLAYGVTIPIKRILIHNDKEGAPKVELIDDLHSETFTIKVSISHTSKEAVAVALVNRGGI